MDIGGLKKKLCRGVSAFEEKDGLQKVEKVLAPFMRTLKKRKHQKADVFPTVHEELYLKRCPKELLTVLQTAFTDDLKLKTLMNETAELLRVVTKSKSVNLYLTDYDSGEIILCPKYYAENPRFERRYPIESGTYLAAHVAFTKEYVIASDILGDMRFPQGIPEVPVVKSVMCLPIITNAEENCIGIIELYRECSEKPYDLTNLQICNALTAWMGIALEENKEKMNLLKEIEIQQQLSHLADLFFSGIIPFSTIVSDTVKMAKAAVNADKGAFYVFHKPVPFLSEDILVADVYEEGIDDSEETFLYKKNNGIRFAPSKPGIAGYVARMGEVINIRDAYKDYRFDRKTDPSYYRTRSVMAVPIKNEKGVLAVITLINCLDYPYFREEDIDLVQSFLCYISLICGYYLLDLDLNKTELTLFITDKLLHFHTRPPPEDFNPIRTFIQSDHQPPSGFFHFDWDATSHEEDALKYIAYIFVTTELYEPFFEQTNLLDFLLRIKKSYRPMFYHNFEHAFAVFHFVVNVILRNKNVYNSSEVATLLLAALCHDIDHFGFTNTFLSLTNDTIYKLYGDFCGEEHRYQFTIYLMQQTDLLSNVSATTYQLIIKNLERLMMSFNLVIHFQCRREITNLLNSDSFDWENPEHRILSQSMILICADYCDCFKQFDVTKRITVAYYRELYKQGDLEKSMGFSPLPMLDRNKIDMSSENQSIFISVVIYPATEILIRLFPNLSNLEELLKNTFSKWGELLQARGLEMWKLNEALTKEKKTAHKITLSNTLSSIKTVVSQDIRSLKI